MWILFIALTLLTSGASYAQSSFSQEGPTFGRRVRNLGMGNTGVALQGSADSSPFYNPAGLTDLTESRIQFLALTFDVSKSAIGLVSDVQDLVDDIDSETTDAGKTRALNNFINENIGDFEHVRLAIDIFNYTRPNFAIGLTLDERMDLSFRNQAYPNFGVRNLGDATLFISGSHSFWDKLVQVGATLRPTLRFALDEADEEVTFADAVADEPNDLEGQFTKVKDRRFGLAVDLGMKSNLAIPGFKELEVYDFLKPEVGFTWQDIGSPDFDAAADNRQSMSIGAAVHPKLWKLKNTVALDFRDLNRDREFISKMHLGVESVLPVAGKTELGLRVGLMQGYFTGGLTLDLVIFKLDAAYYQEEIGDKTRQAGNARYAATISFNI